MKKNYPLFLFLLLLAAGLPRALRAQSTNVAAYTTVVGSIPYETTSTGAILAAVNGGATTRATITTGPLASRFGFRAPTTPRFRPAPTAG